MPKYGGKKYAYTKKGYEDYKKAKKLALSKIVKQKKEVYDQGAI